MAFKAILCASSACLISVFVIYRNVSYIGSVAVCVNVNLYPDFIVLMLERTYLPFFKINRRYPASSRGIVQRYNQLREQSE